MARPGPQDRAAALADWSDTESRWRFLAAGRWRARLRCKLETGIDITSHYSGTGAAEVAFAQILGDRVVSHSACDNNRLCQQVLLNHAGPAGPHHVFNDLCDRPPPEIMERLRIRLRELQAEAGLKTSARPKRARASTPGPEPEEQEEAEEAEAEEEAMGGRTPTLVDETGGSASTPAKIQTGTASTPAEIQDRSASTPAQIQAMGRKWVHEAMHILSAWIPTRGDQGACLRHRCQCAFFPPRTDRYHVEVSGVNCQPWSVAGKRRGWLDDRSLPCLVLIRAVMCIRPNAVCIECTPAFDYGTLEDMWSGIYMGARAVTRPSHQGLPVLRRRLYMRFDLKSSLDEAHVDLSSLLVASCRAWSCRPRAS